jgi:hypothetical protein
VRGAGRKEAVPKATLAYETGGSNNLFGLGWALNLASISRSNGQHLPRYRDFGADADTFSATDLGELVTVLIERGGRWQDESSLVDGLDVTRFRPRVESTFTRVERRTDPTAGESYWLTVSRDNVKRVFGRSHNARLADTAGRHRIARWLLEEECDSMGHCIRYEYKREDLAGVDDSMVAERHRLASAHPEPNLELIRTAKRARSRRPFSVRVAGVLSHICVCSRVSQLPVRRPSSLEPFDGPA